MLTASVTSKTTSSSLAERASSTKQSGSAPKADQSTVDKYKSIFSESSESDSEVSSKKTKSKASSAESKKASKSKRVPSPSPPRLV